jgi:hypothetical protein
MPEEIDRQAILDEEHLKLLSWGYMVSGGMALLFSLFALIYVVMGVLFIFVGQAADATSKAGNAPPAVVGWAIGGIGLVLFLFMVLVGVLKFYTARCLRRRNSRIFCLVIAAFSCLEFPYGTFLGVVTFMVLGRESVARQFTPRAG